MAAVQFVPAIGATIMEDVIIFDAMQQQ